MITLEEIKQIVAEVLQLDDSIEDFDTESGLLGTIPEFDSMAVVTVVTALEENFDIYIEDDEISGETFETLGSLLAFMRQKVAG